MVTRRARSPTRRQPGRPEHATALTASQHGRLKRLRSISPVRKMLARRFPKTLHLKGSMLDPEKDAELIDSDVLALQDILTSDVSEASEKVRECSATAGGDGRRRFAAHLQRRRVVFRDCRDCVADAHRDRAVRGGGAAVARSGAHLHRRAHRPRGQNAALDGRGWWQARPRRVSSPRATVPTASLPMPLRVPPPRHLTPPDPAWTMSNIALVPLPCAPR
eukprot:2392883-Prymnesium_polylepis.2